MSVKLIKFIRYFLSDRTWNVKVGCGQAGLADRVDVTAGVIKDNFLGPLLFHIQWNLDIRNQPEQGVSDIAECPLYKSKFSE